MFALQTWVEKHLSRWISHSHIQGWWHWAVTMLYCCYQFMSISL